MLKKYKVICSQMVFYEAFIEANSEEEACSIAWEGSPDWVEIDSGDWEIDDVQIVRKRA